MVFDCLWVVVDFFEVVADGSRSFLLLVTTQNEVNNCGNLLWIGGRGILFKFHAQILTKFTFHLHI